MRFVALLTLKFVMLRSRVSVSVGSNQVTRLPPTYYLKEGHGGLVCIPTTSCKSPQIRYETSFCWFFLKAAAASHNPASRSLTCCCGNAGLEAFKPQSEDQSARLAFLTLPPPPQRDAPAG